MTILQESSGEQLRPSKRPYDSAFIPSSGTSTPVQSVSTTTPGQNSSSASRRPDAWRNDSYNHRRSGHADQLAKRVKGFSLK